MVKYGSVFVSAPGTVSTPPPSSLICVSGLCRSFITSGRVCRETADGRSRRDQEAGRKGRRERCVVALIWSAILVSANQGLPVLGGA